MSESTAGTPAAQDAPAPKPSETLGQAVTNGEFTYSTSTFTPATATLDELRNRMLLDQESDDAKLRYVPGEPLDPDPIAWKQNYPYDKKMRLAEYEATKRLLQIELLKLQHHVKDPAPRSSSSSRAATRPARAVRSSASWSTSTLAARASSRSRSRPSARSPSGTSSATSSTCPAGEIVLFDRSWYNRAGVERVMGFCSDDEYLEFMRQAPEFERHLSRSGVHLFKLWFSVSRREQQRRFREREVHPLKQWKLSPIDKASLDKWDDYTRAKEAMFFHTDTSDAPWMVIKSDCKKRARLNALRYLLHRLDYEKKDAEQIGAVDPLIVGLAAVIFERGEHTKT